MVQIVCPKYNNHALNFIMSYLLKQINALFQVIIIITVIIQKPEKYYFDNWLIFFFIFQAKM